MTSDIRAIPFSEIDIDSIRFTPFGDNIGDKKTNMQQKIAFPSYRNTNSNSRFLHAELPEIEIEMYGVYTRGDENQKYVLELPLSQDIKSVRIVSDKLKEMGKKFGSDELKAFMFGDKSHKYKYITLFKDQSNIDSNYKLPRMKLKVGVNYKDNNISSSLLICKDKKKNK